MSTRLILATVAIGLVPTVRAAPATVQQELGPLLEPVESIPALTRIHSWNAIDDDTLIIWASAFQPYLIELDRPSHDLKFANTIGVSEFAGQIHARFDSVWIKGLNYRIDQIYKLSPEEAKTL